MTEIDVMEVALMRSRINYKRFEDSRARFPGSVECLEINGQHWFFDIHGILLGVEAKWLT